MAKTTYPITVFSHSIEMESRRLLFVAASLNRRWYQNHGFLVLPTVPAKVPTATVVFPDLPYATIPNFWSRVSRLKLETPIAAPPKLIAEMASLLSGVYNPKVYSRYTDRLAAEFKKIESKFWSNLFILFPVYQSKISKVNIYLTLYGPYTTFNLARDEQSEITIYVRYDCSIDKLLWSILTCLFRPKMQDELRHSWSEIEATVDWLIRESSLNCGLPLSQPTIKNIRSTQIAPFKQQSSAYLATLGLNQISAWKENNHQIWYGDIELSGLSSKEQLLLEYFLVRRGKTVSYDSLADLLWPKGDNFSLFAIAKEIERLRAKIRDCGITSPVLLAHRKVGYSLV
jgi:hypothetical protein